VAEQTLACQERFRLSGTSQIFQLYLLTVLAIPCRLAGQELPETVTATSRCYLINLNVINSINLGGT
jgi:hypothetical protein